MAQAICWAMLAGWQCVMGGKAKEKLYKKINIIDFYWISWYKTANKFQNNLYYGFLLSICLFSFECFFHVHASILMVMIINFYSLRSLTGHTFISSVSSISSVHFVHNVAVWYEDTTAASHTVSHLPITFDPTLYHSSPCP